MHGDRNPSAPGSQFDTSLWLVVYTKPRQESIALENLLRQAYEAWLPMHTCWHRRRGQWHKKVAPMFPRYLILRPGSERQGIASVRSTLGVSGLVRFGHRLATIAEPVVDRLRAVEAQLAIQPDEHTSPFSTGDCVRLVDGPLRGLEGIVACAARDRVAVLLTLLGREKEVVVSPDTLMPSSN